MAISREPKNIPAPKDMPKKDLPDEVSAYLDEFGELWITQYNADAETWDQILVRGESVTEFATNLIRFLTDVLRLREEVELMPRGERRSVVRGDPS